MAYKKRKKKNVLPLFLYQHEFKVAHRKIHFLCNPLSLYTFPLSTFTKKPFTKVLEYQVVTTAKICDATYTFFRMKKCFTLAVLGYLLKPVLGKNSVIFLDPSSHIFWWKSKKKLEMVEIIGKPCQVTILSPHPLQALSKTDGTLVQFSNWLLH